VAAAGPAEAAAGAAAAAPAADAQPAANTQQQQQQGEGAPQQPEQQQQQPQQQQQIDRNIWELQHIVLQHVRQYVQTGCDPQQPMLVRDTRAPSSSM
jgi:hypothetical protein